MPHPPPNPSTGASTKGCAVDADQDKRPTCLVIGAAGGIGQCLCHRLAANGWNLVLAGRNKDTLEALSRELSATYAATTQADAFDATDFDAVSDGFARHDDVTAAVNLAGSILLKPAHLTTADEFQTTIDVNLKTAFAVVRAAGKAFRQTGGSVVLLSTCAASVGLANHEAIAAAKAGVEGLTRAAASTYAAQNIRFNAVAPGLVETPLAMPITSNDAALKASQSMHPLGRIGQPDEVAAAIEFLLAPNNEWITGQTLGVDGGLARVRPR